MIALALRKVRIDGRTVGVPGGMDVLIDPAVVSVVWLEGPATWLSLAVPIVLPPMQGMAMLAGCEARAVCVEQGPGEVRKLINRHLHPQLGPARTGASDEHRAMMRMAMGRSK